MTKYKIILLNDLTLLSRGSASISKRTRLKPFQESPNDKNARVCLVNKNEFIEINSRLFE